MSATAKATNESTLAGIRACAMCKPQQRGWAEKKTQADLRRVVGQEQELWDMNSIKP